MSQTSLAYLSAAEALAAFSARTLSPVELMQAVIARANEVNPRVNAFADTYFEEALAAARVAEARWMGKGEPPRALEGVPLAVKDAQRLAGRRTTQGSLVFANAIDSESDPSIERLTAAGAIVHGRTTTPEFCLSGVCTSRMWGVTRNPHNLDHGPGGSSGGSGAALAAGTTTLATGTDIGGSIRIPASACGIVGFKPPHGRNPDGPPANFDRFNHCGPMTRTVTDAALMQNVTAGPHPLDHDSLRERLVLPLEPEGAKGLRIAWSIDFGYVPVDDEVRASTLAAVAALKEAGAHVEEVDLGWTEAVDRESLHWYNTMHFGRQTIWQRKDHRDLMTDYALKFAEAAERLTGIDDVHRSWERSHLMYQTLGPVLARFDALICPTLTIPAVKADHDPYDPDFFVAGRRVDPEYGWVMTHQFNMLHNCPVLAVPSGRSRSGVPTGIQIVGRTFDDATVFRLGRALERVRPSWFVSPTNHPM
jgi:Asp-tRNA(Asn)/Glu-tRNA(Gln) amidotransferase A subunit family amidase